MCPSKLPDEGTQAKEEEAAPDSQESLQSPERHLVEGLAALEQEVRTPLAVIIGYSSMLRRSHQRLLPEEQDEILQMVQAAGQRLSLLMERLLELVQLELGLFQLKLDRLDPCELARKAMMTAQQQVPEHLQGHMTFHLLCDDEADPAKFIPPVKGDLRCLYKVLEQLLDNAIRFSPSGGRIEVLVQPVSLAQTETLENLSFSEPAFVEICVCDSGVGIAPGHLEQIFERFYRVETRLSRHMAGLGLGLTMCRYLVALHQGRLWAESGPEAGSRFHLWLPTW